MLDDQRPRRVVPRWRPSWITATTIEAKSTLRPIAPPVESQRKVDLEVSQKLHEFDVVRSVPVAAELMFLASAAGNEAAAKQAAEVILASRDQIGSRQLVRSAQQVLQGGSTERIEAASKDFVKHARTLLAIDYRNPVLLMDTARELAALRQDKAALRYVRAAVAMAPNSRFVLRAAARYYLHVGEHEIAHDLLRRSPLIGSDPWVQASEIAIATVRGKTSDLAKQTIKRLSEAKQVGAEVTELASAVGTVELLSGSDKKAKILFKHALSNPNDNSLAQAEWAATKLKLVVDHQALRTPMSYEANSHNAYRRQEIAAAIDFAVLWAKDEPFASRPRDSQCYLLSLEGRYAEALEAARVAHDLDGDDIGPALNLLFAQIQAGDLDNAMEDFLRLGRHPDLKTHATHYLANGGALAYAMGDFEQARQLYQRAIKSARMRGEPYSEGLARAFFARIATHVGDPQASSIVKDSAEIVPRLPSAGAIYVVQNLVDSTKRRELQATASARVAKRVWHWDAISNTLKMLDS
ncbi:tetratricopeptide repeat protein [Acidovorax kalamii]|uniref:tetratricopeptide repeat protein n=1 Tax=Acidovorax kalamii TaxID=2004485 RepID=UPI00209058B8|nr:tetratricopeptide repeat protein [Acidovorax kalamii]MCO5358023.1 tetratricopeptide repeat protein [Acidovorax kalamii]